MYDITDKTAFVTGGSSGIGKAIARRLARAGACRIHQLPQRIGYGVMESTGYSDAPKVTVFHLRSIVV